jgi:hypothetical protein
VHETFVFLPNGRIWSKNKVLRSIFGPERENLEDKEKYIR